MSSADVGQFKEVALSMNAIEDYAIQIESKHALFVFDSCFAGTIFGITRSSHPPVIVNMVGQPVREFILILPIGTRPSKMMANWFSAALQFLIGAYQKEAAEALPRPGFV